MMGGMWQVTEGKNGGVLSWTKKDKERSGTFGRGKSKVSVWACGTWEFCHPRSEAEVAGGHRRPELRREAWAGGAHLRVVRLTTHWRPWLQVLSQAFLARGVCPSHSHSALFSATFDKHLASSQHISKPWGLFSELALGPFIKKQECKHIPSLHNLLATQDWGRCQQ